MNRKFIKALTSNIMIIAIILGQVTQVSAIEQTTKFTQHSEVTSLSVSENFLETTTGSAIDENKYFEDEIVVTPGAIKISHLAAGSYHSLQIETGGTVWAYGRNNYGQLGDGTTTNRTAAKQVKGIHNVVNVAAGDSHSIALNNDGTVWAWGDNRYGQLGDGTSSADRYVPVQVKGINNITEISANGYNSVALKSDGTVWIWGYNGHGQLGNGTTTNSRLPIQVEGLSDVISVSAGRDFCLAAKSDGTVWAWGYNAFGQLGDGTTKDSTQPVNVKYLNDVKKVYAGDNHCIALKIDGTVWTWGYNTYGQLGDGTRESKKVPVEVKKLNCITYISAGYEHSIAVKEDGTVWAWGLNSDMQLGNGATAYGTSLPIQIIGLNDAITVAAGDGHSAALRDDGVVWAWGDNRYGQLGNGTTVNTGTPVLSKDITLPTLPTNLLAKVDENGNPVITWMESIEEDILAGYQIKRDNLIVATTTGTSFTDTSINIELDKIYVYIITAIDVTGNSSEEAIIVINDNEAPSTPEDLKVISKSGSTVSIEWKASTDNLWVDGYAIYRDGQKIGDSKDTSFTDLAVTGITNYQYYVKAYDKSNNFSDESNPINVTTDLLKFISIAGSYHRLQVEAGGTVWACGRNNNGQLGDGKITNRTTIQKVNGINSVVNVAAGYSHSIALKDDGTVWAWGNNEYGQLGDGTLIRRNAPVRVQDLNNIIEISANGYNDIALKNDGTVWIWGNSGNTSNRLPMQVKGLSNVISVAAGKNFYLIAKDDGTVWTWGYNEYGQLGDGTLIDRHVPTQVQDLNNIIEISANEYISIALKIDGTVWIWGRNGTTNSKLPMQVKGLSDVTSVEAGYNFCMAAKIDGTVWAWGDNEFGQLGNESIKYWSSTPNQVNRLTDVKSLVAGINYSAALRDDGTVWAWGDNRYGQLGNGTTVNTGTPVLSKDITSPTVPTNLSTKMDEYGNAIVTWTASKDGDIIREYQIKRDNIIVSTTTGITFTDTSKDIELGKTYVYSITAIDASGNMSEEASTTFDRTSTIVNGDINNDTVVDSLDLALIKMHLLQVKTLTEDKLLAADFNCDRCIDALDYASLKMHLIEKPVEGFQQ